jgi:hypothetical protein
MRQPLQKPISAPFSKVLGPRRRTKGVNSGLIYLVGGGLIGLIIVFVLLLIVVGVAYYYFGQ